MKKFLAPGLIAVAALAVLATSFVYVQAGNGNFNNQGQKNSFLESLTPEQKEALLAKREEMRDLKEELRDLPIEERHEAMQELKEEWIEWAEANEIESNLGFMKRSDRGKGYMKGFGKNGDCPMAD